MSVCLITFCKQDNCNEFIRALTDLECHGINLGHGKSGNFVDGEGKMLYIA